MLNLNFSSCLEGVPLEWRLEVFKKLGYCSWLSRIVCIKKIGSLSLDSCGYRQIARIIIIIYKFVKLLHIALP